MTAVSDSSPLILYSAIDRLDLLHALFGDIVVPAAVWREVVTHGADRAGTREVRGAAWIVVQPVLPLGPATSAATLDPGEAEAIALAEVLGSNVPVLLDDRRARRVARQLGLAVVGSGGVLRLAKNAGLIDRVRPTLSALLAAGLYLDEQTISDLLRGAEER